MKNLLSCSLITLAVLSATIGPRASAEEIGVSKDPDSRGRSTAVALNYCRASFHRIRRIQSKRVLIEEKEKILNNLNLNGIGDEAVIKLYSAVLDEISQIDIAEREELAIKDKYKKAVYRQIGQTAFFMAAQFATASMESMARTGVNSWLDYRDLRWSREFDQWKVEKSRIQAVVDKSSKFLDTFWKLAQTKNIPDRWLVRGNDLDNLAKAIAEEDLDRRLRVLKRMEPFMECFPPYWYYVARTQQGLGKLYEAAKTYDKLADLAAGHFRKDDMLAASLANRAIIQEYLQQDGAERSALEALKYSSAVWEANLMCAQVLERHKLTDEAEDAILRNLDVKLEVPRSATALLGLYYRQNNAKKIAKVLNNDDWLEQLPMISLLQASKKLNGEELPPKLVSRIQQTIGVTVDRNFGADDLVLICDPIWQANQAQIAIRLPAQAKVVVSNAAATTKTAQRQLLATGETVIRYRGITETGNPLQRRSVSLTGTVAEFRYGPKTSKLPVLKVVFGPPVRRTDPQATWWPAASPASIQFGNTSIDLIRTRLQVARKPPGPNTSPGKSNHRGPVLPEPRDYQVKNGSADRNETQRAPRLPTDRTELGRKRSATKQTTIPSAATTQDAKRGSSTKPSDVVPSTQPRAAIAGPDRSVPRITILGIRAYVDPDPDAERLEEPAEDRVAPPPPE